MVARRLALLLALLMLMSALAAQLAPRQSDSEGELTNRPAATPSPATAGDADLIERTIPAGEAEPAIVEAHVGDTIRLEVASDEPVSIELEQLDEIEVASPDGPARFEVFADRPGTFPIVVVETGREIGRLEISAG